MDLISVEATRNYLSIIVQDVGNPDKVMCINVYGPQLLEDKKKMISDLETSEREIGTLTRF
jgi:hypothetical protein